MQLLHIIFSITAIMTALHWVPLQSHSVLCGS